MADGSLVVVDKSKPLPAAVIADAAAPAQVAQVAQNAVPASGLQEQNAAGQQANDVITMVANGVARDVFTKTGKSAEVVYRQYLAPAATPDTYQWMWTASVGSNGAVLSKDAKVAQVQAYTTTQTVPAENSVVIVLN